MAKAISALNSITDVANGDILAVVDVSVSPDETKQITVSDFMKNLDDQIEIGAGDVAFPNGGVKIGGSGAPIRNIDVVDTGAAGVRLDGDTNGDASTGDPVGLIEARWNATTIGQFRFLAGDDAADDDEGDIQVRTASAGTLSEVARFHQEGHVEHTSVGIKYKSTTETNDGMTANPETATEDAFLSVDIGSNSYQIPLYSA